MSKKAIIIGGTGATGKHLVHQLLNNKNWDKVTTIGRMPALNGAKHEKLNDIVLNNLYDLSSTKGVWANHDIFINCIGTTKQRAGSSKDFRNIEVNISENAAILASEENIPHATLISANGANKNQWSKDFIHPLFYIKTMGEKEDTILNNRFKSTSIYRPGMLVRLINNQLNWIQELMIKTNIGIRVDVLAAAMIYNAENIDTSFNLNSSKIFSGNRTIKKILPGNID